MYERGHCCLRVLESRADYREGRSQLRVHVRLDGEFAADGARNHVSGEFARHPTDDPSGRFQVTLPTTSEKCCVANRKPGSWMCPPNSLRNAFMRSQCSCRYWSARLMYPSSIADNVACLNSGVTRNVVRPPPNSMSVDSPRRMKYITRYWSALVRSSSGLSCTRRSASSSSRRSS